MRKPGDGASRKEHAQRTGQEIRDKALELFRQKGFDETSVDEISRAAGVSKGAFYAHYRSKVSLIYEYLGSLDLDYRQRYAAMSGTSDAASVLFHFSASIAEVLETRLGLDILRVVYRAEVSREISLDPFISRDRELYRILGEILEKGAGDGSFRPDIDTARVADHIVMAIRGMVFEWCSRGPDFDLRKELAAHMNMMLDGIRAEGRLLGPNRLSIRHSLSFKLSVRSRNPPSIEHEPLFSSGRKARSS